MNTFIMSRMINGRKFLFIIITTILLYFEAGALLFLLIQGTLFYGVFPSLTFILPLILFVVIAADIGTVIWLLMRNIRRCVVVDYEKRNIFPLYKETKNIYPILHIVLNVVAGLFIVYGYIHGWFFDTLGVVNSKATNFAHIYVLLWGVNDLALIVLQIINAILLSKEKRLSDQT